jgi:hypothetical protein
MTGASLEWVADKSGWITVHEARGRHGKYTIKRTGGRHFPWEVRLGDKRCSGRTMRSCKAIAEHWEARDVL